MTSPESITPPTEVTIEIPVRFALANLALNEVHRHERTAEVEVYLQNLLDESEVKELQGLQAADVPYPVYRDIGVKLRDRLKDEGDQRSVKVRDDENRVYRVKYDPDATRRDTPRSMRTGINYLFGIR